MHISNNSEETDVTKSRDSKQLAHFKIYSNRHC